MKLRKTVAALVATTLSGSALLLTSVPASAAEADDPTFTPVAADLIGVGSDTSQGAMHLLGEAWSSRTPAPAFRVASFAATGGGQITLPSGPIDRPNGSGAGKSRLYGTSNNPDIDFARSSSSQTTAETQAGLQSFPFALDTLVMAVSGSVPSNAPTSLTPTQIVGIYSGDIKNWSEIDSTRSGVIAPKIPQSGSGTRAFFVSQLKSMNGGTDVTLAATVAEVQEHDATPIKNDPNAIAPFSEGRASLLPGTLRLETGWKADRALYNTVRGTGVGNPAIQTIFASDGYLCSTEARSLIEEAGFKQLATPARGGVCGAPTQSATSNFTLNEAVVTTTTLTGTSPKGGVAKLTAQVGGATAPSGTVDFYRGDQLLQAGVPLVSGQATHSETGLAPGAAAFRAVFQPESGSQFEPSQDEAQVMVRAASVVTETFAKAVAAGKRAKGDVKVSLTGSAGKATGQVVVKLGRKTVGSGKLSGGEVTLRLGKLPEGLNRLKAIYRGSDTAAPAKKKFTIKQK